jgi:hypothetical protein
MPTISDWIPWTLFSRDNCLSLITGIMSNLDETVYNVSNFAYISWKILVGGGWETFGEDLWSMNDIYRACWSGLCGVLYGTLWKCWVLKCSAEVITADAFAWPYKTLLALFKWLDTGVYEWLLCTYYWITEEYLVILMENTLN